VAKDASGVGAALVAGKGHMANKRLSERELQVLSLMADGVRPDAA
jgi:ATP/maltotriose-dependent transcriptional regulator MalT